MEIEDLPIQFKQGLRMIMLTLRGKDGGLKTRPDRIAKKKLSTCPEEFDKIVKEFQEEMRGSDIGLRIYSSVNARDIKKAQREFKERQLEADYFDEESKNQFYLDIKNRWISCVMKPSCRAETFFLFDADNLTRKTIGEAIDKIDEITDVVWHYKTKNGYHIIAKPFNPNDLKENFGEIKKDALLLLDF